MQLAALSPERMPFLELGDELKLPPQGQFQHRAVGHVREIEQSRAHCPPVLIPLDGAAIGVTPGIGGVVERGEIGERPIEKIVARIAGVSGVVEHVGHREFSEGDDNAIAGLAPAKLVQVGVDVLDVAAEVDGLAEEEARQLGIGRRLADLVGLTARKAGNAERIAEPETLVELAIDPGLAAVPQPSTEIDCDVRRLVAAAPRIETVGAAIRRAESGMILVDERRLAVDGPVFGRRIRIGRVAGGGRPRQGNEYRRPDQRGCADAGSCWLLADRRHGPLRRMSFHSFVQLACRSPPNCLPRAMGSIYPMGYISSIPWGYTATPK